MPIYESEDEKIEALQWTGDNLEEMKCFIDQYIVESDEAGYLCISNRKGESAAFPPGVIFKKEDKALRYMSPKGFNEIYKPVDQ